MSKQKFIADEKLSKSNQVITLNWRLFSSLSLFKKLLPLSVTCVILASVLPSVFRWYAGGYSGAYSGSNKSAKSAHEFSFENLIWLLVWTVALRIIAWALFETSGIWSTQSIYAKMIRALSKTRTTFFDENPSGRIINRLVRDYEEVRLTAIIFAGDFFNAMIETLSVAALACFASPWAALMIIPLLVGFFIIHGKRSILLEHYRDRSAIANSQVLNRQTDLIDGREIYILYGKGSHLLDRMLESLKGYLQTSLLTFDIDAWASFWMRVFAEIFAVIVLIFVTRAVHQGRLEIFLAGVVISSLFAIIGSISWLDIATGFVARSAPHIARVFQVVDLPTEEEEEFSTPRIESGTLSSNAHPMVGGDIVFDNYTMSYRKNSPMILEDLNLKISSGSKTALIGRTGSGKSSIIQSLFRMVHVVQGDIRIGEKSIFDQDIQEVRRQFGVVPQFPYLFAGNLRQNLDRAGVLTDDQLQSALSSVGLLYPLNHPISEGGQDLSMGERQLICLARVIASDRKFVFMDEPTSGLDPETDYKIHRLLNSALKDKTVVTIAHRRESLIHYDSVIELKSGVKTNISRTLAS